MLGQNPAYSAQKIPEREFFVRLFATHLFASNKDKWHVILEAYSLKERYSFTKIMQENMLPQQRPQLSDKIESVLQAISQHVSVFLFGLLPLIFVPVLYLPGDYVKTAFVIVGICIGLIFWSLSVLRSGKIVIGGPLALWALWIAALSSACGFFEKS